MSSPALCLSLALAVLAAGAAALGLGWPAGWLAVAGALWLARGCLRSAGVPQAFEAFKNGDLAAVRTAVGRVPWVRALSPQNRAYYHWLEGAVLAADGDLTAARPRLLEAAAGAIQTENDRSLIQCLLAEIALQLGEPDSARIHLSMARRLVHQAGVDAMIAAIDARLGGARGRAAGAAK